MSRADERLEEALGPLRRVHLADLRARIDLAREAGAEVTPEPWRRDAQGRTRREGRLRLPSRHDLEIDGGQRRLHPRVETPLEAEFQPFAALGPEDFALDIRPFRWEAAELVLHLTHARPNWTPLRLWFLEFSQSGQGFEAPGLLGVLHALGDPRAMGAGAAMRIDFGSAPLSAVAALAAAAAQTGAGRARLGEGPV